MPGERPYSKRELDLKFQNLQEKNDAWSATILNAVESGNKSHSSAIQDMREHEIKPILEQTIKTNGRVNKLEARADRHERRWTWLTGAAFILVPIFVTVCGWVILRQLEFDQSVESAVDNKFKSYETRTQINIE